MASCGCGCGGRACVPQPECDGSRTNPLSRYEPEETILFSVNGHCGYPLSDALKEQYAGLDGKGDKIFVDFKSPALRLGVCPSTLV